MPTLFKQALGGLLWGLFFILAPMVLLIPCVVIWLPIMIWRERVRARRHGLMPGLLLRLAVMVLVVTAAAKAPTKPDDRRVGPFPSTNITLGELAKAGVIYEFSDFPHHDLRLQLPSTNPTQGEVVQAIRQQTTLKASTMRCGNGANILFGCHAGRLIMVYDPKATAQVSKP